jgi:hypothetical protein
MLLEMSETLKDKERGNRAVQEYRQKFYYLSSSGN